MIDYYFWATLNGYKGLLFLKEGERFAPYLAHQVFE